MNNQKIPVRKALLLMISSLGASLLLFFAVHAYLRFLEKTRSVDPSYNIQVIAQRCHTDEALHSVHLEEMLALSSDKPSNMYRFDKKKLEKRLRSYPVIKDAAVALVDPAILFVDYSLREPVALLADYENMALDCYGNCFPLLPYMAPKKLPEIILGNALQLEETSTQTELGFQKAVSGEHIDLAFSILHYMNGPFSDRRFSLSSIDVQKAFLLSADREIVIVLHSDTMCRYLIRLPSRDWREGIKLFLKLYPIFIERALATQSEKQSSAGKPSHLLSLPSTEQVIIDLRLPKLAFVKRV